MYFHPSQALSQLLLQSDNSLFCVGFPLYLSFQEIHFVQFLCDLYLFVHFVDYFSTSYGPCQCNSNLLWSVDNKTKTLSQSPISYPWPSYHSGVCTPLHLSTDSFWPTHRSLPGGFCSQVHSGKYFALAEFAHVY